jgi:hypothetical protein
MTMETRKNTDYSQSALMLTNPPAVEVALMELLTKQQVLDDLKAQAAALIPQELTDRIAQAATAVAEKNAEVRQAIDNFGSYQNLTTGWYALKQVKVKREYLAEPFIENFPKFAPAVIEQTVNVKALDGLVKGHLITEDDLKGAGVINESKSYAYIIK